MPEYNGTEFANYDDLPDLEENVSEDLEGEQTSAVAESEAQADLSNQNDEEDATNEVVAIENSVLCVHSEEVPEACNHCSAFRLYVEMCSQLFFSFLHHDTCGAGTAILVADGNGGLSVYEAHNEMKALESKGGSKGEVKAEA